MSTQYGEQYNGVNLVGTQSQPNVGQPNVGQPNVAISVTTQPAIGGQQYAYVPNQQYDQQYVGQPYGGQPYAGQPMGQPYGQPMGQPYGQPMGQPYGQQQYVQTQNGEPQPMQVQPMQTTMIIQQPVPMMRVLYPPYVDNMCLYIVTCLFCNMCCLGLIGLCYGCQARDAAARGDLIAAARLQFYANRFARLGIIFTIIYVIFQIVLEYSA